MTTDEKYFTCEYCLHCLKNSDGDAFCHHRGGFSPTNPKQFCTRPDNYTPFKTIQEYRMSSLRDCYHSPTSPILSEMQRKVLELNEKERKRLKIFLKNHKINSEPFHP